MVEQQKELTWQQKFNIAYWLCVIHQRGIVVVTRKSFGVQALGRECALAFIVMALWATVTQDIFMYVWIGLWFVSLIQRRIEATKLTKAGVVSSYYDGFPINCGKDEKLAKLWIEPILTGVLGAFLYWLYQQNGLPTRGLPTFLFLGFMTLRVVESVKAKVRERRLMAMNDAKLEQESLAQECRDQFGN
jgi:hypothetical protein